MKHLLALSLVLGSLQLASAALPYFDPLADKAGNGGSSYLVGGPLAGQSDGNGNIWNSLGGNFPGTEPTIVAGNLNYLGLPPATGNSVSFAPAASMSARLNFNAVVTNGNSAYYSFILKITDISAVPTTAANNYFACFSDGSAAQVQQLARAGTRILTRKVGSGFVLGVGRNNNTADYVYGTNVFNVNEVIFVVGSYELVGGVTNVNFWINPDSSSFGTSTPPPPTLSLPTYSSTTGALNNNGVQGFVVLCQFTNAPSGILDEVRISTNWVAVTGGDPAILQNPSNQTRPEGGTATFNVQARGTPTLSYQWLKDGSPLSDGGNIAGASTATLTINNVSSANLGSYSAYVTNGLGDFVASASATLALADPAVVNHPQSRTNDFGTTATFTVTASGTSPFTYQWQKNGNPLSNGGNISGANSATLTVANLAFPDGGNYSVLVSNALSWAQSESAGLTVNDPYIATPPVSLTRVQGENAIFSVTADGSGPLTYQWRKNGNLIFDLGKYSGTATASMTVSDVASSDEGGYSVAIVGAYNTVISSDAFLTVQTPVAITAQPTPRTVLAGSKTAFAVGVSGTGPFFFQWLHDDAVIADATAAAYVVTNAQTGQEGNYSVVVSNALNVVTSAVAALVVESSLTFGPANLAVLRVGDGALALSANGNSMFMDQFATNGLYLNTASFPETGTNALITQGPNAVPSPSSVTATTLSRSADGRFLVVAGYNTEVGYPSSLHTSTAAAVPRGIGLIDGAGQYTLGLASTTAFSGTFWRSAVFDGTNNYWGAARTPGTYYFGLDSAPALVQSNFSNIRSMALFNGDIYCVSAVSANSGVMKLAGMPKTAAEANPAVLFSTSTGSSDVEVSPTGTLIYLADDRALPNGGVQRWEFNGTTWALVYTLTNSLPLGARYLTADFNGSIPVIYAVSKETGDDNNRIVRIEDTGAEALGVTLAYAGANQNFRGIRFGPAGGSVAPPTLSFLQEGSNIILSWESGFTLQSSTNVVGPYNDLNSATSPHTNSAVGNAQQFFRLRN